MTRFRSFLTGFALLLLTGISLAAAARTFMAGVPEAPPSGQTALFEILATRDVAGDPPSSRRYLAERLERELGRDPRWFEAFEKLDAAKRSRFLANAVELAHVAFLNKVERYDRERAPHRKERFLDRQIDEILSWAPLLVDQPRDGSKPDLGFAATTVVIGRIGQWAAQADATERAKIDRFLRALQQRVMARVRRAVGPGPP